MCDDPECGNCNRDTKQLFVKAGLELGDAIIEVVNKQTPQIGDTTENGLAGYVKAQVQAVAFASAVAAMIVNFKLEATQDLLLEQIISNIRHLVDIDRRDTRSPFEKVMQQGTNSVH